MCSFFPASQMREAKRKMEEEIRRKRDEANLLGKCKSTPMSSDLRKDLRDYINIIAEDVEQCPLPSTQQQQQQQQQIQQQSKCTNKEIKSFSCTIDPTHEELEPTYYPNKFLHHKCGTCKECMYGSGLCVEDTMDVVIYHDEQDKGPDYLYMWKEQTKTISVGCKCVAQPKSALLELLEQHCRGKDPAKCFAKHKRR